MVILSKFLVDSTNHCCDSVKNVITTFNTRLSKQEPIVLIVGSCFVYHIYVNFDKIINRDLNETYWEFIKRKTTRILLVTPYIGPSMKKEIDKQLNKLRHDLMKVYNNEAFRLELPREGLSKDDVVNEVDQYFKYDTVEWKNGFVSGGIYTRLDDGDFLDLMSTVFSKTAYTNPLHSDVFPSVRKMEAEIVRMTCTLFKGGPETCGCVTTGGTESIVLAVKSYRDYARHQLGISEPEIIVPKTAHPAFDKAAAMLHVKIVHIDVDEKTKKVDIGKLFRAINRRTALLVGSAPGFPHGIFDDIEKIAEIGLRYGIPVHVDSCLGGFLVPFVDKAGFKIDTICDFSLPGVTSISADSHKYGYSPKGTSVLMYADIKYRHEQFFVVPNWPGGIYASPTILGSRMGAAVATCWASIMYHGLNGYVANTKAILETTKNLVEKLREIDGIEVLGEPKLSVVAVGSKKFNVHLLSDDLTKKGWNLNALQSPPAFHVCVTMMHTKAGVIDQLIDDIREITAKHVKDNNGPVTDGNAALYGIVQKIPDKSMVSVFANHFLDAYYSTSFDEPKSNGINGVNGVKG